MTELEKINNYNRRCTDFLGAIYSNHAEAWGFGNAKNIGSMTINGIEYKDVIQAERFEKELKFHSDWNWIMEVVEAIEKLKFNVRMTYSCITIETGIECTYNMSTIHKFHSMQGEFETKKEAVVEAIDKFLIWYEKNK